MRRTLIGGMAAGLLLLSAPAWSHDGPPYGHAYGHWKHGKQWRKHSAHHHTVRERYVVREVVRTVPVYPQPYYVTAAPGVHVIFPNVYIPFD